MQITNIIGYLHVLGPNSERYSILNTIFPNSTLRHKHREKLSNRRLIASKKNFMLWIFVRRTRAQVKSAKCQDFRHRNDYFILN